MWVKHRACLQLGFWGLIGHPEHGRGFGVPQRVWGALGEPWGHGMVAESSSFQRWGKGGREILALNLSNMDARGNSCRHFGVCRVMLGVVVTELPV